MTKKQFRPERSHAVSSTGYPTYIEGRRRFLRQLGLVLASGATLTVPGCADDAGPLRGPDMFLLRDSAGLPDIFMLQDTAGVPDTWRPDMSVFRDSAGLPDIFMHESGGQPDVVHDAARDAGTEGAPLDTGKEAP